MNELSETVRNLLILLVFCALSCAAYADTWVNGYVKRDGAYVSGYYRRNSDTTHLGNYSAEDKSNPHTGATVTRARDYSSLARNYGDGHVIYTGPRGGQHYINGDGNKIYVPKH